MVIDKNELMKLSPAERIKKLDEMEDQRKKEIEESEKLKKQAEMQMFEKAVAEDKPPQDLREFTGRKLEDTIAHEKIPDIPPEGHIQYANPVENAIDLYEKMKGYAEREAITGDDAQTVGYLYDVFNEVVEEMSSKEQEIEQIASGMKRVVKDIMGEYHANVKYDSEIK